MAYSDYSYTALTQAEFFKAEAELIRFGERLAHSPSAKYLKDTLLAIDAIFAVRSRISAFLTLRFTRGNAMFCATVIWGYRA